MSGSSAPLYQVGYIQVLPFSFRARVPEETNCIPPRKSCLVTGIQREMKPEKVSRNFAETRVKLHGTMFRRAPLPGLNVAPESPEFASPSYEILYATLRAHVSGVLQHRVESLTQRALAFCHPWLSYYTTSVTVTFFRISKPDAECPTRRVDRVMEATLTMRRRSPPPIPPVPDFCSVKNARENTGGRARCAKQRKLPNERLQLCVMFACITATITKLPSAAQIV